MRFCLVMTLLVAMTAHAETPLAKARNGFKTKLQPKKLVEWKLEEPPPELFRIVMYPGPAGTLRAHLGIPAKDAKKLPAIIWLTGGFAPGGIGKEAWTHQSPADDESAAQYREAGVLMMYPTTRGMAGNGGTFESLLGEADDVLAALKFLKTVPEVDPARIYLGGWDSGATLALLVAELSSEFQGVFAFGPHAAASELDAKTTPFDLKNEAEVKVRSPVYWLDTIETPTWIIEGRLGNKKGFSGLRLSSENPKITFVDLRGGSHTSALAPLNAAFAKQMVYGKVVLTPEAAEKAFDARAIEPATWRSKDGWSFTLTSDFDEIKSKETAALPFVLVRVSETSTVPTTIQLQQLPGAIPTQGCVKGLERLGTPVETKWRSFSICMLRTVQKSQTDLTQDDFVALVAQLPLAPKGIQVMVVGPAREEAETKALFDRLLSSFEGPTTWDPKP